jgi:hypothetical protein
MVEKFIFVFQTETFRTSLKMLMDSDISTYTDLAAEILSTPSPSARRQKNLELGGA